MCGLFGGFDVSFLSLGERDVVRQLGVLSLFRGIHSTGLAHCWTKSKRKSSAIHSLTTSPELLYGKETSELFGNAKLDSNLIFGHTRHATVGALSIANAHPFVFHNIIGVHNGTIPCLRNDNKKENPDELSDSYYLYKSIEENGLDATIKSLSEWSSAYALVMYDKKVNHLRFLRNKERPLFFAATTTGTVYWSSTDLNLGYALRNTNYWASLTKEGITSFPTNHVHTYDFNTNKWLEPYKLAPDKKVHHMGRWDGWEDHFHGTGQEWKQEGWWQEEKKEGQKKVPNPTVPLIGKPKEAEKAHPTAASHPLTAQEIANQGVSNFSDDEYIYKGFRGRPMSIRYASELLAKGDAYWSEPRSLSDSVLWFSDTDFIMYKDKDDLFVRQYLLASNSSTYSGIIARKPKAKEVAVG